VTTRRRLSPEDRREDILSAARDVFRETGLHGTTMADVAERAGITQPHLYRYFRKEDLYRHAVLGPLEELRDRVIRETRDLAEQPDITRAQLLEHFHQLCLDYFVELIPLLRASPAWSPAGGWLDQQSLVPQWRELVVAVISDISGWETESLNLELLVRAFMGLYATIALVGELAGTKVNTERAAAGLTSMFAPTHLDSRDRAALRRALDRAPAGARPDQADAAPAAEAQAEAGAPKRTRLKKAERQAAILQAVRGLFCEVGFSGARTQELAERAGITEAFLYRLFPSKEQLYEAAVEAPVEHALIELSQAVRELAGRRTGVSFVIEFNVLALRFCLEYGYLLATAFGAELDRSRRFFRDRAAPQFDAIGEVIIERMGYEAQVSSRLAWCAFLGSAWGVAQGAAGQGTEVSVEALAVHLTRIFTLGVIPTGRPRSATA
jgi:AcrR family transcriptional regulator